jgi:predicted NUDIX family NTP pyrophosphohydrolase
MVVLMTTIMRHLRRIVYRELEVPWDLPMQSEPLRRNVLRRAVTCANIDFVPKLSAGLLLYRFAAGELEVFLVHPGGPFWQKKDAGAWSLPKGEPAPGEELEAAARRELEEETGCRPAGELLPLSPRRQAGGKTVHAWAAAGDCDPASIHSNTFTIEWPPRSGKQRQFPEIDRAGWFPLAEARVKILAGQAGFLDELAARLAGMAFPPARERSRS